MCTLNSCKWQHITNASQPKAGNPLPGTANGFIHIEENCVISCCMNLMQLEAGLSISPLPIIFVR